MSDYKVRINIKNRELETIAVQEFELDDFVEEVQKQLMGIIGNIEESFLFLQGYQPRVDWPTPAKNRFEMIRHKILNQANTIRRLPDTLCYQGNPVKGVSLSEALADQLNHKE